MIDMQQSLAVYDKGNDVSAHSDWVDFIAYDESRRELFVRLQENPTTVYVYHDVPPSVFSEMSNNHSVGGYYSTWIKGNYTGERLNDYDLVWRPDFTDPKQDEGVKVADDQQEGESTGPHVRYDASGVPFFNYVSHASAQATSPVTNALNNEVFVKGTVLVDSPVPGNDRIRVTLQNRFHNVSPAAAVLTMKQAAKVLGLEFTTKEVTEYFE